MAKAFRIVQSEALKSTRNEMNGQLRVVSRRRRLVVRLVRSERAGQSILGKVSGIVSVGIARR